MIFVKLYPFLLHCYGGGECGVFFFWATQNTSLFFFFGGIIDTYPRCIYYVIVKVNVPVSLRAKNDLLRMILCARLREKPADECLFLECGEFLPMIVFSKKKKTVSNYKYL